MPFIDGIQPHGEPPRVPPTVPITPGTKSRHFRAKWLLVAAVAVVGLLVIGLVIWRSRPADTFSASLQSQAGFPLYYPAKVPSGYSYKPSSARLAGGVVFVAFTDGDLRISMAEQSLPAGLPPLANLAAYKPLAVPAGQAVAASAKNDKTVLVKTKTTLITIHAGDASPLSALEQLAQQLHTVS